ncbi:MAG: terminase gpA endonuclease subunit [Planctomycetota bacterium]
MKNGTHARGSAGFAGPSLYDGVPRDNAERLADDVVRRVLTLPERLRVSEWVQRNIVLPGGDHVEPGPIDLNRTPYCIAVLDAWDDPRVQFIALPWAAQAGKTVSLGGMLCYTVGHLRRTAGYMMPTADRMERESKRRIAPMLEACRATARELRPEREANSLLAKMFRSGHFLSMNGSNSDAAIRGPSIGPYLIDEYDAAEFDHSMANEARARGKNLPPAHTCMVIASTLGHEGVGLDAEMSTCTQYHYHVPCPRCGAYQTLKFANLHWPRPDGVRGRDVDPESARRTAHMLCERHACRAEPHGGRITERDKPWMLAMGVWAAGHELIESSGAVLETRDLPAEDTEGPGGLGLAWKTHDAMRDEIGDPDTDGRLGVRVVGDQGLGPRVAYRLGSLYSPFTTFGDFAAEWILSGGRITLKLAGNWFGEAYREPGDRIDRYGAIRLCDVAVPGRNRIGTVPHWAAALCLSADLQKDRAVCVIRAWSPRGRRSALVWAGEIETAAGGQLRELDPLRTLTLPMEQNEHGNRAQPMPIRSAVIDSGDGNRVDEVYAWALRWNRETKKTGRGSTARPAKGVSNADVPIQKTVISVSSFRGRQHEKNRDLKTLFQDEGVQLLKVSKPYYTGNVYQRVRSAMGIGDGADAVLEEVDRQQAGPSGWVYPERWEAGTDDAVCQTINTGETPIARRVSAGQYFGELTAAEMRTTTDKKGNSKAEYVVIGGRQDHMLDAERYGVALMHVTNVRRLTRRPDLVESPPAGVERAKAGGTKTVGERAAGKIAARQRSPRGAERFRNV